MIVGATGTYGYNIGRELGCRIHTLEQLKKAFLILRSEISFNVETLPCAFINVADKCDSKEVQVKTFFADVGKELSAQPKKELKTVWETACTRLAQQTCLDGRDYDKLAGLSASLGYLDAARQLSNIDMYISCLTSDIEELAGRYRRCSRMYTGLGIMAGLFLFIILV